MPLVCDLGKPPDLGVRLSVPSLRIRLDCWFGSEAVCS